MEEDTTSGIPIYSTMEKYVSHYIALRDALDVFDKRKDEERKKVTDVQEQVLLKIQTFMEANAIQNLKTKSGTCFFKTRWSATVADAEAFMSHVIDTKDFDLLERRASTVAVKAYVEEHKAEPPGCNLRAYKQVQVRR